MTVFRHPDEAFWAGLKIHQATPIMARMLGLFCQFDQVSHMALLCLLGAHTQDSTMKVHISRLRDALSNVSQGQCRIGNIHGLGYFMEILDHAPSQRRRLPPRVCKGPTDQSRNALSKARKERRGE